MKKALKKANILQHSLKPRSNALDISLESARQMSSDVLLFQRRWPNALDFHSTFHSTLHKRACDSPRKSPPLLFCPILINTKLSKSKCKAIAALIVIIRGYEKKAKRGNTRAWMTRRQDRGYVQNFAYCACVDSQKSSRMSRAWPNAPDNNT